MWRRNLNAPCGWTSARSTQRRLPRAEVTPHSGVFTPPPLSFHQEVVRARQSVNQSVSQAAYKGAVSQSSRGKSSSSTHVRPSSSKILSDYCQASPIKGSGERERASERAIKVSRCPEIIIRWCLRPDTRIMNTDAKQAGKCETYSDSAAAGTGSTCWWWWWWWFSFVVFTFIRFWINRLSGVKDDHFSLMKYCQSLEPGQRSENADV